MGLKKYVKRATGKVSNYFKRAETGLEKTWDRYKYPIMQIGATALAAIPGIGIPLAMLANAGVAAGQQAYEGRKAEKEAKRMGKNMFKPSSPFKAFRGAGEGSVDFTASSPSSGVQAR